MADRNKPLDLLTGLDRLPGIYKSPLEDFLDSPAMRATRMFEESKSPLEGFLDSETLRATRMFEESKSLLDGFLDSETLRATRMFEGVKSPLEGFLDSETLRAMRMFEEFKSPLEGFLDSETLRAMRMFEEFKSPLEGFLGASMRQLHEMHKLPLEDFLASQMAHAHELHESAWGGALTSQLTQLSSFFTEHASIGDYAAKLAATGVAGGFAPALIDAAVTAAELIRHSDPNDLDTLSDARAQSVVIDAVAEVEQLVRSEAQASPQELLQKTIAAWVGVVTRTLGRLGTTVSRQEVAGLVQLLNFMIMVIMTSYQIHLAKQTSDGGALDMARLKAEIKEGNEAQVEELRKTRETLERFLQEQEREEDRQEEINIYRIDRPTYLTSERSTESERIMRLHPGQFVTRVRKHYKWLEVECYDYLSGRTMRGWVMKKHLRPVSIDMGNSE